MKQTKEPNYESYLLHHLNEIQKLEKEIAIESSQKIIKEKKNTIKEILSHLQNINKTALKNIEKILIMLKDHKLDSYVLPPNMELELKKNNLVYKVSKRKKLSKFENNIIRMDCSGIMGPVNSNNLSEEYLNNKFQKQRISLYINKEDISTHPQWKIFRQFPNFQGLENKVLKTLNNLNITPKTFKQMTQEDFMDAIFISSIHLSRSRLTDGVKVFTGEKEKFVKDFINRFKKPFIEILNDMEENPIYISALVKEMEKHGNCSNIVATDKKGSQIKGTNFQVDHGTPVTCANDFENISEVNLFSNFRIVPENLHQPLLHGLPMKEDQEFFKRIDFKDPNIVFFGSLSQSHIISFDYSQTQEEKEKLEMIKNSMNYGNENKINKFKSNLIPFNPRYATNLYNLSFNR